MSNHAFHLKTLKNGLRVVIVPQPHATTVTALVLVAVGSLYESAKQGGLSHFLEHMYFKGTTRRPSAKAIAEELEALGAISNASTGPEYTDYYVKGNPAHIDTFVDMLGDIYRNSTFPDIEIQKEKGVIIEELNMYEDMPQYKVQQTLAHLLYGDQPAGRPIIGTKATIQSFNRKNFIQYKDKFYTAPNTIVVLSGNVAVKRGIALVEKAFGTLPSASLNKNKKTNDRQKTPAVEVFTKTTDQAHLMIGFRSVAVGDTDLPAIKLLSTILGRGMSSRLFLLLREELGAAYYANAHQDTGKDHGVFVISAGVDKTRLREILGYIVKECTRMKEELVSEKELSKAKEFSIGMMRLGLELSDDLATFYGAQLVFRKNIKTLEERIKEIKAIKATDITRVARRIFRKEQANLALVGPFKKSDVGVQVFRGLSTKISK